MSLLTKKIKTVTAITFAAALGMSSTAMASTAIFSGGQLVAINDVNVAGFGLFDATFHDIWQGGTYSQAFVDATGQGALMDFTGSGFAQGTPVDYFPQATLGCEDEDVCGWATVVSTFDSGGILKAHVGVFENWAEADDGMDAYNVFILSLSGGLQTNFRDYTFLEWTPSNVSAVPVPAALVMFAPALLGFLGFRRKAKNSIA